MADEAVTAGVKLRGAELVLTDRRVLGTYTASSFGIKTSEAVRIQPLGSVTFVGMDTGFDPGTTALGVLLLLAGLVLAIESPAFLLLAILGVVVLILARRVSLVIADASGNKQSCVVGGGDRSEARRFATIVGQVIASPRLASAPPPSPGATAAF